MGKKRVLQILVPCIIVAAIAGIYLIKNPPVSEPLGGRSRAEDDFADEAGDEEDFLS